MELFSIRIQRTFQLVSTSNNYCDSLNLVLKLFPEIDREKLEKELDK